MFKSLIVLCSVFLIHGVASAQVSPTVLYHCQSQIEDFTGFTVSQVTDPSDPTLKATYILQNDWLPEDIWYQSGEAKFSPGGAPVFQSQFEKKTIPPEDSTTIPTWEEETLYSFISINESGTGSLSVDGGLEPIFCEKLY